VVLVACLNVKFCWFVTNRVKAPNSSQIFDFLRQSPGLASSASIFENKNILLVPFGSKFLLKFLKYFLINSMMACAIGLDLGSASQCRINHMAEAAYATGPALLGAPRFSLLFFF
jgi:hypothetical protein